MTAHLPAPGDLPLRGIHLPPDPSWWPPAPGWWLLFAAICISLAAGYWLYRRKRIARIWQNKVLAEVRQLDVRHAHDDVAYAAALHQLLRRVAWRYAADAHHVQGEPWRRVLAQMTADDATLDALMTLEARMYQPRVDFDRTKVAEAAYRWLHAARQHMKPLERSHA
jgi:hypothetical protein